MRCINHFVAARLAIDATHRSFQLNATRRRSFGQGVNVNVKLIGLGDLDEATGTRECFFEVNGFPRSVKRLDETASSNVVVRPKADSSQIGAVGAPMPGVVVDVKVAVGDSVSAGDPMVVRSSA